MTKSLHQNGSTSECACWQRKRSEVSDNARPCSFFSLTNYGSYLNGKMVVILVGEEENQAAHSFYIHKELLMRRSAFFAKTLEGYAALDKDDEFIKIINWKEGIEGTVKLPKDDPEIFAAYVHLIYYEKLPISHNPDQPMVSPEATPGEQKRAQIQLDHLVGEAVEHEYDIMSKLYVFATRFKTAMRRRLLSKLLSRLPRKHGPMDERIIVPLSPSTTSTSTLHLRTLFGNF